MFRPSRRAALVAALLAAPALALAADVAIGDRLGGDEAAIRAALTEQGYEVRKIEAEDGKFEAYAVRDGKRYEFHVDRATGAVRKIEVKG